MSIAARPTIVTTQFDCPVGPLTAAATDAGVCLLEFAGPRVADHTAALSQRLGAVAAPGTHRHLDSLRDELAAYFSGTLREFSVPLVFPGTPFQERVWGELRRIPFGTTRSYEDVALAIGDAKAVRAVGTANGRNRVAIVIPCHRVVNKGGGLGGYGGGLDRKRFLLDLERRHS